MDKVLLARKRKEKKLHWSGLLPLLSSALQNES